MYQQKFQIVTNNPMVREQFGDVYDVKFLSDYSIKQIMMSVRDMCMSGHELLTHPLSGSVKPGETPYKSVLVAKEAGKPDYSGAELADAATQACDKFVAMHKDWSPSVLDDFQLVDYTLISSGIESAVR